MRAPAKSRRFAPRAILLLSGGLDSAVAGALAKARGRRLIALSIDYGQRHRKELGFARRQARLLGAKRVLFKLPLGLLASGALVDGKAVNKAGLKAGRPSTYVSFRNGIFLSLAFALAEREGASEVWGGWCGADYGGYPDCRKPFFSAMEKAGRLGRWAGPLKIVAPLARLGKSQTLKLGKRLGVDFKTTWTCYDPRRGRPCGGCDACRVRRQAFLDARMNDR